MSRNFLKFLFTVFIFVTAVVFTRCNFLSGGVVVEWENPPFLHLSEYRFFTGNIAQLKPNDRVLPYDLITPLFSDYAEKARFVWMPKGESAKYSTEGVLQFPVGTVLIKNFYFPKDLSKPEEERRIMETRLLVHQEAGWDALPYIWNEAQTEAKLDIIGDVVPVTWKSESGEEVGTNYLIPNKNQCQGCHSFDKVMQPIGPKVRNLNQDFEYAEGRMNQLEKWANVGYLSGFTSVEEAPKIARWNDPSSGTLHERAMAYLDVNCAHCHNPSGPAGISGLGLEYTEASLASLGVCKPPVAAAKGSGGRIYSIVPGKPDESIFMYRLESTDPGEMMPELGRTLVHKEGVELIREWITAMRPVGCDSIGDFN